MDNELLFRMRFVGGREAVAEAQTIASGIEAAAKKVSDSAANSAANYFKQTQGYLPTIQRQASEAEAVVAQIPQTAKIARDALNYVGPGPSLKEWEQQGNLVKQAEADFARYASSHIQTETLLAESSKVLTRTQATNVKTANDLAIKSLKEQESAVGSLGNSFSRLASQMAPVLIGVGAVGAGIAAAGVTLFEMAKKASDAGAQLHDLSLKTGLNIESLSALKFAADESGSSIESASRAVVLFQKQLTSAELGSEKARELLTKLGIDTAASLKDPNVAIRQLAAALNGPMPEGYNKTTLAQKLMGRSGADLLSTFDRMGGSFDDFLEKARRMGVVMTEEDIKAADDFRVSLRVLETQFAVTANKFALEYAPQISGAMKDISATIADSKDLIKLFGVAVAEQFREVRGALRETAVEWARFRSLFPTESAWLGGMGGKPTLSTSEPTPRETEVVDYGNAVETTYEGQRIRTPEQIEAERKRAQGLLVQARQSAREAKETAAETLYKEAIDAAQDTFKHTGDLVELTNQLKTAEESRWAAAKVNYADERAQLQSEVASTAEAKQARADKIIAFDQKVAAAHTEHLQKMKDYDENFNSQSLSQLQERHRRENELEDQQSRFYLDKLKARAEQGSITYVEAERRMTTEVVRVMNERLAKLGEEADAAKGDARATAEIGQQISLLKGQIDNFVSSGASEGMFGALGKDADKYIEKLKEIMKLQVETKPVEIKGIGGEGKYSLDVMGQRFGGIDSSGMGPPPDMFSVWEGFGRTVSGVLSQLSEQAGNFGNIISNVFGAVGQAVGNVVRSYVLLGSAGGSARKWAAEVIASVAQMSAVKAVFELAEGLAATARAFFGDPRAAGEASFHYASAAQYGAVAGIAAVAGRAIAGSAFASGGGAVAGQAYSGAGGGTSERDRTIREGRTGGAPDPNVAQSIAHVPITLTLDGRVLEQKIVHIYRQNGQLRGELRQDMLSEPPSY